MHNSNEPGQSLYITALTYVSDRVELFSHRLSKFSQLDHTIQHQRLACCFYLVECKNFYQIPRLIYNKHDVANIHNVDQTLC